MTNKQLEALVSALNGISMALIREKDASRFDSERAARLARELNEVEKARGVVEWYDPQMPLTRIWLDVYVGSKSFGDDGAMREDVLVKKGAEIVAEDVSRPVLFLPELIQHLVKLLEETTAEIEQTRECGIKVGRIRE